MSYIYMFFAFLWERSVLPAKKQQIIFKYPYKLVFFKKFDLFLMNIHNTPVLLNSFRVFFRKTIKQGGYFLFSGFIFFYKHLRYWIVPILLFLIVFYFSMYIRCAPFFKIVLEYFLVINVFYWLISGFVFFIKKYKYNRFTAAVQRFWRRSLILFWLIESSLFIVFIYLLFNASQESVFTFDLIQINKQRLYSWKFFIYKSFFVFLLIITTYILLVSIKWNIFSKVNNMLFIITLLLTYIVWLEFYQFFYIINWYGEIAWLFDSDDKVWYAESIFKRARIVNHYVTICVIAKFWHIIFIYIFWVFFLLRSIEQNKISYLLLSANYQNFIILYIMNWLLMYPWVKFIFRKFLTFNHKSFYEFRNNILSGFYCDFFIFCKAAFVKGKSFKVFKIKPFYYSSNLNVGLHSFNKDFIRPQVVETFFYL